MNEPKLIGSDEDIDMAEALLQIAGLWLAMAVACWLVARYKNLDEKVWFLRGLAFGAFALGFLLLEPGD